MASEGVIRVACDRMDCGPIEVVAIGVRQVVRFYAATAAGERQICEAVLTWPDTQPVPVSVDVQPPHRGAGD